MTVAICMDHGMRHASRISDAQILKAIRRWQCPTESNRTPANYNARIFRHTPTPYQPSPTWHQQKSLKSRKKTLQLASLWCQDASQNNWLVFWFHSLRSWTNNPHPAPPPLPIAASQGGEFLVTIQKTSTQKGPHKNMQIPNIVLKNAHVQGMSI